MAVAYPEYPRGGGREGEVGEGHMGGEGRAMWEGRTVVGAGVLMAQTVGH